jgi:hypothetical protein
MSIGGLFCSRNHPSMGPVGTVSSRLRNTSKSWELNSDPFSNAPFTVGIQLGPRMYTPLQLAAHTYGPTPFSLHAAEPCVTFSFLDTPDAWLGATRAMQKEEIPTVS